MGVSVVRNPLSVISRWFSEFDPTPDLYSRRAPRKSSNEEEARRSFRQPKHGNYGRASEEAQAVQAVQRRNYGPTLSAAKWPKAPLPLLQKNFYTEHADVAKRPETDRLRFEESNQVAVSGKGNVPAPIFHFHEAGFPDEVLKMLENANFGEPTAIQKVAWPIASSGRDFVGVAQTGSGKTLAYILPALKHILGNRNPSSAGPHVVVLCPTRELAIQVHAVAQAYCSAVLVRSAVVYGGAPRFPQQQALRRNPDLVIATPGRLNDFLHSSDIDLQRVSFLVLDEADRMLDMGFEPQIRQSVEQTRPDRQTLMWSATWPRDVRTLAEDFLSDYVSVNIGSMELAANPDIKQEIIFVRSSEKVNKLAELLETLMTNEHHKTLVFVGMKRVADALTSMMRRAGIPAYALHGDKCQSEREYILEGFRSGRTTILIATEVASRGIDVDDIEFVVNYDYPNDAEQYVHRVGRTGRRGRKGTAYTFFSDENAAHAAALISVLTATGQEVPLQLRQMSSYGGRPPQQRFPNRSTSTNFIPLNSRSAPADSDWVGRRQRWQ